MAAILADRPRLPGAAGHTVHPCFALADAVGLVVARAGQDRRSSAVPLVALGYPLYVLGCVLLSLDALRRPGASDRMMGDVARATGQPWLVAASLLLTAVGALVAAVLVWTITNTRQDGYYLLTRTALTTIGWFDLVISVLIAAVVLLLGQAMTAYELFTEKALPRQGVGAPVAARASCSRPVMAC